jgi:GDP-4-dehydro-6-deoxy-D-mannose reductase
MASSVLVTGAAGFVGSHLLELLAQDNVEVTAWQRPGTEPLLDLDGVHWQIVELQNRDEVYSTIRALQPSQVYHLAGVPHVGDSWGHTRETFAGNVLGTHHLFEALRRNALAPRVLITSSATVYTPADRALNEDDEALPNNPYGTSKLAQEMVALRAWQEDGVPALIARAFNHVGPRQSPSFLAPSIAKQIAEIEKGRLEPVLKVGNLEPKRDIMDVRDTVKAYRAMMQSARPGLIYNVCSGQPVAVKHLMQLFIDHARVPVSVEQDPARFRPNDTPLIVGDCSRLRSDTGWEPKVPLDQTVEDLLAYWRSQ